MYDSLEDKEFSWKAFEHTHGRTPTKIIAYTLLIGSVLFMVVGPFADSIIETPVYETKTETVVPKVENKMMITHDWNSLSDQDRMTVCKSWDMFPEVSRAAFIQVWPTKNEWVILEKKLIKYC